MLDMFTPPWPLVGVYLVAYALSGLGIGALTGWLVALIERSRPAAVLKDGLLGSMGFLSGFFVAVLMPWHRNTITYRLDGGTTVTSTMNSYQHPERVAIVVAILLPLLSELHRRRKPNGAKPA
jgi:hypothetical protein